MLRRGNFQHTRILLLGALGDLGGCSAAHSPEEPYKVYTWPLRIARPLYASLKNSEKANSVWSEKKS